MQRSIVVQMPTNLERRNRSLIVEKVIEAKVVLAHSGRIGRYCMTRDKMHFTEIRTHCEALDIIPEYPHHKAYRTLSTTNQMIVLGKFPRIIRYQAVHSLHCSVGSDDPSVMYPLLNLNQFRRASSAKQGWWRWCCPWKSGSDASLEKSKFARVNDFDLALMKYVDTSHP